MEFRDGDLVSGAASRKLVALNLVLVVVKERQMNNPELTMRESKVLQAIMVAGRPVAIDDMARELFARERPLNKARSRVRNALRRLVADGIVERVERGRYAPVAPVELEAPSVDAKDAA